MDIHKVFAKSLEGNVKTLYKIKKTTLTDFQNFVSRSFDIFETETWKILKIVFN